MSKLMSDLNNLNQSRKRDEGVIIEEAQENQEQAHVVPEYKGIYFLSFLMILLIGFSVLSLSISLKTFAQLEDSQTDVKTILKELSKQQNDIVALQTLITDKGSEELARIEGLKGQIGELKVALENRKDDFSKMQIAYSDLKVSTEGSIEELKLSEGLLLEKYSLLNDQFEKFRKENFFISNTY